MNGPQHLEAAEQALAAAETARQAHLDYLSHSGRRESHADTLDWQMRRADMHLRLARLALDAENTGGEL